MNPEQIQKLIDQGEGVDIEFKSSRTELNRDTFETICAFLNRTGGHLLLGVKDDGTVQGVDEGAVKDIKTNIITLANNPQKLNPPCYLEPQVIEFEGEQIIYLYIPESSHVHSTTGKTFDRGEDGDLDVTRNPDQIRQLHLMKQSSYSENTVYPYLKLADLSVDIFNRVRRRIENRNENHIWLGMSNEEMLKSAGFYLHDYASGKDGYTLAAALLFGTDLVIRNILPHHRTDAIKRVENLDRYDDRETIKTNLIDSYDQLMAFVRKHLSDPYFSENDQTISIRDKIFHEVVGNLLIHREYIHAFPAKLIIERDRVVTENWNRPHGIGSIDPSLFTPFPKNPSISAFFREIGLADELGSGVRNCYKYCRIYSGGADPEFVENDVFKMIIPLSSEAVPDVAGEVTVKRRESVGKTSGKILAAIEQNNTITIPELAEHIGVTERSIERNIQKLKSDGLLKRVGGRKEGHWEVLG